MGGKKEGWKEKRKKRKKEGREGDSERSLPKFDLRLTTTK